MFCRGIADDDDDEEEEETKSMESIGRISALEVDVQSVVELESKLLLRWRDCDPAAAPTRHRPHRLILQGLKVDYWTPSYSVTLTKMVIQIMGQISSLPSDWIGGTVKNVLTLPKES
jgi:hypothetical protein